MILETLVVKAVAAKVIALAHGAAIAHGAGAVGGHAVANAAAQMAPHGLSVLQGTVSAAPAAFSAPVAAGAATTHAALAGSAATAGHAAAAASGPSGWQMLEWAVEALGAVGAGRVAWDSAGSLAAAGKALAQGNAEEAGRLVEEAWKKSSPLRRVSARPLLASTLAHLPQADKGAVLRGMEELRRSGDGEVARQSWLPDWDEEKAMDGWDQLLNRSERKVSQALRISPAGA